MSKFVIECPNCGKYAEAKTGFFASKKIYCACGNVIDVQTERMVGRTCPHCGNVVIYDRGSKKDQFCPVCDAQINGPDALDNMADFSCAQCGVRLRTSKSAEKYVCPVCDFENFIPERLMSEQIKKDGVLTVNVKTKGGSNITYSLKDASGKEVANVVGK